ncbi:pyridoxal-phosphate-dependent aminotransferase family protein [Couchioplanes azureus]|uniref:pyridoxal-phosphate-dependent aminotransferase family protein n=1 Tax=Couchioplanes caeruleus TaxID=56438 RepID=UPI0016704709|nr:aminotransferase class V-fold PLP-dependent enzyme [Couchioplanes caeruleus]GGQ67915.1 alanine--glyoxylate aminotransferase [Couchioplanes caeruleus subsp. azureus]
MTAPHPAGRPADPATPRLMIPGPCQPRPEVLAAFQRPVAAHYGPSWARTHEEALTLLRQVLGANRAYLLPGSGSLAVEAAVVNTFRPGQRVVIPHTGYFGRRLIEVARAYGLAVHDLAVEPGRAVEPRRVADLLPGADGVVLVHVETSTGIRHPVADIAAVARQAGAAVVVDAVSSVAGEELDVQGWGADAVAASTQKGLGCPPGLGVVALSERGHARILDDHPRPWYLDLRRWDREREESFDWEPHPVTMPTNLVFALIASLRAIVDRGLPEWRRERTYVADHCRERLTERGFTLVGAPAHRAALVVVARCGRPADARLRVLREAGIAIAGGLDPVRDAIRIGLMGRHGTFEMVDECTAALGTNRWPCGS